MTGCFLCPLPLPLCPLVVAILVITEVSISVIFGAVSGSGFLGADPALLLPT